MLVKIGLDLVEFCLLEVRFGLFLSDSPAAATGQSGAAGLVLAVLPFCLWSACFRGYLSRTCSRGSWSVSEGFSQVCSLPVADT